MPLDDQGIGLQRRPQMILSLSGDPDDDDSPVLAAMNPAH